MAASLRPEVAPTPLEIYHYERRPHTRAIIGKGFRPIDRLPLTFEFYERAVSMPAPGEGATDGTAALACTSMGDLSSIFIQIKVLTNARPLPTHPKPLFSHSLPPRILSMIHSTYNSTP